MNVTINETGPCRKLLRIELSEAEINAAFEEIENDFVRHANLPGFRKGKAPRDMVARAFEQQIREEVRNKIIRDSYRKAVEEQKLRVYDLLDIEDAELKTLERNKPTSFVVTVEVWPQFELPNYRNLPARREARTVTEADIDHAIELLRGRHARFEKVDREVRTGDVVVVNYRGTVDGKPIAELGPDSKSLGESQSFWIEVREGAFLPGFGEQLLGARAGDRRTVTVNFPAGFPSSALAGRQGVYEVEVLEVKERVLPPVDDAFAQLWEAKDVASLREGVRQDLQNELNETQRRSIREQVVRALLSQVNFDLPETAVLDETRNVVFDIVRENQQRGVSKEVIDRNKDDIYNAANAAGRERVKAGFVFAKIAEREGIKVLPHEFHARLLALAQAAGMPADKYLKELEKRHAVSQITELVLKEKVIDFLQQNAKIEDVPPSPAPA